MLQKILRATGYFLAFILFLLLFVRITFPTDALGNLLKLRLADAVGATDVKLGEVSLIGLVPSGVELEELEVALPDVTLKGPTPDKDRKVGRVLHAERIAVEASLGRLMGGEVDATFEGTVMGGELKGGRIVFPKEGDAEIRVESIEGVAIGAERLVAAATGFDVRGVLSGSIDLRVPMTAEDGARKPDLSGLDGTVTLTIADTTVKAPVIEQQGMRQPLTDVKLGTLRLAAKVGGGGGASPDARRPRAGATTIAIEEFSASGPDIQVGIAPRAAIVIPSGRALSQATLRTHFAVRIDPAFIEKEIDDPDKPGEKTRPNKALGFVLETLGRKGHVLEDNIGVSVTGSMSKPSVTTERPRTRIDASGTAARRMKVDAEDEGEEEDDEVEEEEFPAGRRPGRQGSAGSIARPAAGGGRPVAATPVGGSARAMAVDARRAIQSSARPGDASRVEPVKGMTPVEVAPRGGQPEEFDFNEDTAEEE